MNDSNNYLERASCSWTEDSIRQIITPSSTAKTLYFYVQEAGYFKTAFPYFTERQNLNSFLMVYTVSGRGFLRYEDKEYEVGPGQCFYINCMQHHYYSTRQDDTWEFLWVHFNGNNALGYYEEFIKSGFRILNMPDSFFMESTMHRILAVNAKKDVTTEVVTSSLLADLLTECLIQNLTNDAAAIFIPPYIKAVMKYIDQNFRSPLSLHELSLLYGVSKFHLSKEFKKHTGITVNEYIITTRISYAKELLKYSDSSIEEITFKAGMNHVSHFINLFKARENMTPLAYRKEWTGL